ncbi:hypothetical protein SHIRM173S_07764 [Streptomyces hirsutus]
MSTVHVPQQPHHPDGPAPPEVASVPPHASEATRLLCGGVYVDPDYRDRVIDELYLHEQRIVPRRSASTPPGSWRTRCAPAGRSCSGPPGSSGSGRWASR